jgi:hypothetical protein
LAAEGERLAAAARTSEAVERFQQALDLEPPEAVRGRALRGLAIAHHRAGDRMAALKYDLLYQPYCPAAERPALDTEIALLRTEVLGGMR